jgi:hypothetical protein
MVSAVGLMALVGCGGSGSSSTILMGSVTGESGTTTGVTVSAASAVESFASEVELPSDGDFRFTSVPDGLIEVSVTRSGESTGLDFDVEVQSGRTSEVDLYLMTWTPEPVGELRLREGGSSSMGDVSPVGPSGTSMTTSGDDRVYETPKGLVVTRKSDGSVVVDDSGFTP